MEQRTRSNSKRTSPPQPPPLRTSLYSAPGGGRSPLSAPPQAPHEGKGLFGDGGAHPPQASSSFPQQQSGRFQPNLFGKQQRTIYFTLTEAAAAAGGATGGRGVQRAASASASATHANARGGVIARHQSDNASTSTYTTTSEGSSSSKRRGDTSSSSHTNSSTTLSTTNSSTTTASALTTSTATPSLSSSIYAGRHRDPRGNGTAGLPTRSRHAPTEAAPQQQQQQLSHDHHHRHHENIPTSGGGAAFRRLFGADAEGFGDGASECADTKRVRGDGANAPNNAATVGPLNDNDNKKHQRDGSVPTNDDLYAAVGIDPQALRALLRGGRRPKAKAGEEGGQEDEDDVHAIFSGVAIPEGLSGRLRAALRRHARRHKSDKIKEGGGANCSAHSHSTSATTCTACSTCNGTASLCSCCESSSTRCSCDACHSSSFSSRSSSSYSGSCSCSECAADEASQCSCGCCDDGQTEGERAELGTAGNMGVVGADDARCAGGDALHPATGAEAKANTSALLLPIPPMAMTQTDSPAGEGDGLRPPSAVHTCNVSAALSAFEELLAEEGAGPSHGRGVRHSHRHHHRHSRHNTSSNVNRSGHAVAAAMVPPSIAACIATNNNSNTEQSLIGEGEERKGLLLFNKDGGLVGTSAPIPELLWPRTAGGFGGADVFSDSKEMVLFSGSGGVAPLTLLPQYKDLVLSRGEANGGGGSDLQQPTAANGGEENGVAAQTPLQVPVVAPPTTAEAETALAKALIEQLRAEGLIVSGGGGLGIGGAAASLSFAGVNNTTQLPSQPALLPSEAEAAAVAAEQKRRREEEEEAAERERALQRAKAIKEAEEKEAAAQQERAEAEEAEAAERLRRRAAEEEREAVLLGLRQRTRRLEADLATAEATAIVQQDRSARSAAEKEAAIAALSAECAAAGGALAVTRLTIDEMAARVALTHRAERPLRRWAALHSAVALEEPQRREAIVAEAVSSAAFLAVLGHRLRMGIGFSGTGTAHSDEQSERGAEATAHVFTHSEGSLPRQHLPAGSKKAAAVAALSPSDLLGAEEGKAPTPRKTVTVNDDGTADEERHGGHKETRLPRQQSPPTQDDTTATHIAAKRAVVDADSNANPLDAFAPTSSAAAASAAAEDRFDDYADSSDDEAARAAIFMGDDGGDDENDGDKKAAVAKRNGGERGSAQVAVGAVDDGGGAESPPPLPALVASSSLHYSLAPATPTTPAAASASASAPSEGLAFIPPTMSDTPIAAAAAAKKAADMKALTTEKATEAADRKRLQREEEEQKASVDAAAAPLSSDAHVAATQAFAAGALASYGGGGGGGASAANATVNRYAAVMSSIGSSGVMGSGGGRGSSDPFGLAAGAFREELSGSIGGRRTLPPGAGPEEEAVTVTSSDGMPLLNTSLNTKTSKADGEEASGDFVGSLGSSRRRRAAVCLSDDIADADDTAAAVVTVGSPSAAEAVSRAGGVGDAERTILAADTTAETALGIVATPAPSDRSRTAEGGATDTTTTTVSNHSAFIVKGFTFGLNDYASAAAADTTEHSSFLFGAGGGDAAVPSNKGNAFFTSPSSGAAPLRSPSHLSLTAAASHSMRRSAAAIDAALAVLLVAGSTNHPNRTAEQNATAFAATEALLLSQIGNNIAVNQPQTMRQRTTTTTTATVTDRMEAMLDLLSAALSAAEAHDRRARSSESSAATAAAAVGRAVHSAFSELAALVNANEAAQSASALLKSNATVLIVEEAEQRAAIVSECFEEIVSMSSRERSVFSSLLRTEEAAKGAAAAGPAMRRVGQLEAELARSQAELATAVNGRSRLTALLLSTESGLVDRAALDRRALAPLGPNAANSSSANRSTTCDGVLAADIPIHERFARAHAAAARSVAAQRYPHEPIVVPLGAADAGPPPY